MELDAIAACVIGGTSLMGGRGSLTGTFCGVLIVATVTTPGLCVTWMAKALLLPTSPVAAVAVSVNGP